MPNQGADGAYNTIIQMVDEVLIQAEAHLRNLKEDVKQQMTQKSCSSTTIVSNSETNVDHLSNSSKRSTSSTCSTRSSCSTDQSLKEMGKVRIKTSSYRSLDKKKAVVMAKLKSDNEEIPDIDVREIERLSKPAVDEQSSGNPVNHIENFRSQVSAAKISKKNNVFCKVYGLCAHYSSGITVMNMMAKLQALESSHPQKPDGKFSKSRIEQQVRSYLRQKSARTTAQQP